MGAESVVPNLRFYLFGSENVWVPNLMGSESSGNLQVQEIQMFELQPGHAICLIMITTAHLA